MTEKSGQLNEAIEVLKQHKSTTDKFKHSIGDQYVSDAIDTVVEHCEQKTYTAQDMEAFYRWIQNTDYYFDEQGTRWYNDFDGNEYTFDEIVKEWEEQK